MRSMEERRGSVRRAAVVAGVFLGAVLGWTAYDNGAAVAQVFVATSIWGIAGAAAGALLAWTRIIWRAENGRWHVSRTASALIVGTPLAALGGWLAGGDPPSIALAMAASGVWILFVLVLRILLRLREMRREGV